MKRYIILIPLILLIASCNKGPSVIITKPLSVIGKLISGMFVAQRETNVLTVRIRNDFFVYFPNFDTKKEDEKALLKYIKQHLVSIGEKLCVSLEKSVRKKKNFPYINSNKYRVFIEPRFLTFYSDEQETTINGKYVIGIQVQAFVRDKRTGKELKRITVFSSSLKKYFMYEYLNNKILEENLQLVSDIAINKIILKLKNS